MNRSLIILLWALSFCLPGCNIWEDRDSCPTYLLVDCSRLEGKALKADIWIFRKGGSLVCRTSVGEHDFYQPHRFEVEKGEYICYVWSGIGKGTVTSDLGSVSGTLLKAANIDADELFSFMAEADCQKNPARVDVYPRKMFINVTVTVKGLKNEDMTSLCLSSPWGGFNLGGEGIRLDNFVLAEGNDLLKARMLRPSSLDGIKLELSFLFGDGNTLDSEFDLGQFLKENNYNLAEDIVKDIYITVDISKLKAFVGQDPWDKVPQVFIQY